MSKQFNERLQQIRSSHAALLATKNEALVYNGLVTRYKHPVLTAAHVPIE
jgi:4-O-beta-D-mannosyl-D-glucose phosphorylase